MTAMDNASITGYTDLRTLVNIDPPVYDPITDRETVVRPRKHLSRSQRYRNSSSWNWKEEIRGLKLTIDETALTAELKVTKAEQNARDRAQSSQGWREKVDELETTQEETTDQLIQANKEIRDLKKQLESAQTSKLNRRRSTMSMHEKDLKDGALEVRETPNEDRTKPIADEAIPDETEISRKELKVPTEPKELATEPGDRSRPVTIEKRNVSRKKGKKGRKIRPPRIKLVPPPKTEEDSVSQKSSSMRSRQNSKHSLKPAEPAPDDGLATLTEDEIIDFDDEFPLTDEAKWSSVPANHVYSRFIQYRKLTTKRLEEVDYQLNVIVNKTQLKVNTLKAQFMEHKSKWEKERAILIRHIEQAQTMQGQAEEEANAAINQLEEFINQQEQLEEEELEKRKSLGEVGLEEILRSKPEPLQLSTPSERNQDLLSQTDDAKSVELNKRLSQSRGSTRPPSVVEEPAQRSLPQSRGRTPGDPLVEEGEVQKTEVATQAPSVTGPSPVLVSRGVSAASLGARAESAHSGRSSKAADAVRATPKSAGFTEERGTLMSRQSSRGQRGAFYDDERVRQLYDIESSLSDEQQRVIHSVRTMLQSEFSLTDIQRSALQTIRQSLMSLAKNGPPTSATKRVGIESEVITYSEDSLPVPTNNAASRTPSGILKKRQLSNEEALDAALLEEFSGRTLSMFILANAIAGTCMRMGLQPASLFDAFAALNRVNLADFDPMQKLSTLLDDGPDVPLKELRIFTVEFDDGDENRDEPEAEHEEEIEEVIETEGVTIVPVPDFTEPVTPSNSADSIILEQSKSSSPGTSNSLRLPSASKLLLPPTRSASQLSLGYSAVTEGGLSPGMMNYSLRGSSPYYDKQTSLQDDFNTPNVSIAPPTRGTTPYNLRISSAVSVQSVSDSTLAYGPRMTSADLRDLPPYSAVPSRTPSQGVCAAQVLRAAQWRHYGRQFSIDQLSDESEIIKAKISGDSPEEVIRSAAQSRASLREAHKSALSSLRANLEERRATSPAMSNLRKKSVLTDAELDENGDMPFPRDESRAEREAREKRDMATSPMTIVKEPTRDSLLTKLKKIRTLLDQLSLGRQLPMAEHPVVQEYLRTYEGVLTFKEQLAKLFSDKDMMSLAQTLNDLEPVGFDKEEKVQNQIEEMTASCYIILEESVNMINNLLTNEREYPVSSLSHERTSLDGREKTEEELNEDKGSTRSPSSAHTTRSQELNRQYEALQAKYEEDKRKYDEQLSHNTVLMMDMQDTINNLQRELAALTAQAADLNKPPGTPPVMFSRMDSERNAKTMKRAVNERKLDPNAYKSAVNQMDEYVSLPAKRLAHLVNKYVHHCQMKRVEKNVRKKKNLDDRVFNTLEKMEDLQKERAHRWAEHMDAMGHRRMQLAHMLMDSLNTVEQESGIFLIKPMYSFKPSTPERLSNLAKFSKYKREATSYNAPDNNAPQSTPAKNATEAVTPKPAKEEDKGLPSTIPLGDYPRPVWSQSTSEVNNDVPVGSSHLNIPRILELDVNRMMIGHNQISVTVPAMYSSADRLVNAANANVRSYMTVNRPFGQPGSRRSKTQESVAMKRPKSGNDLSETPATQEDERPGSSASIRSVGRAIPSTSPLPPIGSANSNKDVPLPPPSPPGSSVNRTASGLDDRAISNLSSVGVPIEAED